MEPDHSDDVRTMPGIDRVRCLSCGTLYVKPAGGSTVSANPGCPDCGYVGWVLAGSPFRGAVRHHSGEDRLRRRAG